VDENPEADTRECAECFEDFTPSKEHDADLVCDECVSEKGKQQRYFKPLACECNHDDEEEVVVLKYENTLEGFEKYLTDNEIKNTGIKLLRDFLTDFVDEIPNRMLRYFEIDKYANAILDEGVATYFIFDFINNTFLETDDINSDNVYIDNTYNAEGERIWTVCAGDEYWVAEHY
jgi:hypothetical protein